MMRTRSHNSDQLKAQLQSLQRMTRFHVYENRHMVKEMQFDKAQITIGRNRKADLLLDHQSVADIHALVHFEANQVVLTNQFPQNGLRLNGRAVHRANLQHEDVIAIGPFALKIKIEVDRDAQADRGTSTYCVRLVNRYDSSTAFEAAARSLAKLLRADKDKVRVLIEKPHCIIKKGLTGIEAAQIQNALLNSGVVCDVQMDLPRAASPATNQPLAAEADGEASASELSGQPIDEKEASFEDAYDPANLFDLPPDAWYVEDEEDEDGNVWEAPFSLKQELSKFCVPSRGADQVTCLQVVKTVGDTVIDRASLKRRQKYHVETGGQRICLAHHRNDGCTVHFPATFSGYVRDASGTAVADLEGYKIEAYQSRKHNALFAVPLPYDQTLILEDANCIYQLTWIQPAASPHVIAPPTPKAFSWRHWASSLGVHFILLLTLVVWSYFQASAPESKAPHFVKIDPSMLQKPEVPKVAPKKAPPPKPEPKKPVKAVQQAKKKPPKKKKALPVKTAKKSIASKKTARATQPSKHSKAGGGFGKGNIKNRNINQTGLLSVLGNTSLTGPSEAIASVTNLDAVAVPGATEKNFSVGGLKGTLGNGKISVASGQMVQTKGSQQVLRSAGARGKGDVAALERGSTGKKQVQAMVTAKMSRTVKIEGGMSREMVKRVIDQHLEEITYCYETALMTNPTILGRIVFEWKIMMNGRVGEVRIVSSSVNSNSIHGCIKSAIKTWQFPKPVGSEVVVSYPFVFDLVAF